MKRIFMMLLLALCLGSVSAQQAQPTNQVADAAKKENNKAFLEDHFKQSYDALERSVAGLTPEQLSFKPAADRWSISQCLEHIVITERMLFAEAKKGLESPESPNRRKEVKITDEEVLKAIRDRSHKAQAPEALAPKGKYTDPKQALQELEGDRKAIMAYLNTRPLEDLRNHITDTFFGPTDSFHSFLYIAGHTGRHTLQIDEVKADPRFPK